MTRIGRAAWGTLGVVALVCVAASYGGGGDSPASGPAASVERSGRASEASPVPDGVAALGPFEYAATYQSLLESMLGLARSIRTAEDARRYAPSFADRSRRMEEMVTGMEGENGLAVLAAFGLRGIRLTWLTLRISAETNRITRDPTMRQAFSEAFAVGIRSDP